MPKNKGFSAPKYTQVPNDFFEMIPDMGDAEVKLMLIMCRYTFGYHRDKFRMSLTKLQKATGLSRQGVVNAANAAEKRGLLSKIKTDGVNQWVVNVVDQVGNKVDQSVNEVDQESQRSRPPSIKEKLKEKDKEKELVIDPLIQKIIQSLSLSPDLRPITDRLEGATTKGHNNGDNGTIQITVPDAEDRDWLEARATKYIENALTGLGRTEKLEFVKGSA